MWKKDFKKGKELILSTSSSKGEPNSNIVISLGLIKDKILVADCQMNTTIKNLQENANICVIGGYFRIKGTVEIFSEGKYLDICKEGNDGYEVKNAILITINEVFDLDEMKVLY